MNDESQLLVAIRLAPDGDPVRMAYADWLEVRGDSRCEVVRAEQELRQTRCQLAPLLAGCRASWLADLLGLVAISVNQYLEPDHLRLAIEITGLPLKRMFDGPRNGSFKAHDLMCRVILSEDRPPWMLPYPLAVRLRDALAEAHVALEIGRIGDAVQGRRERHHERHHERHRLTSPGEETSMLAEESQFLADIRDSPGDDSRREAYAEWLASRNDPRAKVIRGERQIRVALPKLRKQIDSCDAAWLADVLALTGVSIRSPPSPEARGDALRLIHQATGHREGQTLEMLMRGWLFAPDRREREIIVRRVFLGIEERSRHPWLMSYRQAIELQENLAAIDVTSDLFPIAESPPSPRLLEKR